MIQARLTPKQARALIAASSMIRLECMLRDLRIVGADLRDLREGQEALEAALGRPEPGEFALGVNEFERRTWDPREAA